MSVPVTVALFTVGCASIRHVIARLCGSRLLVLARGLRYVVQGGCSVMGGVLMGCALLILRVVVWIIVVGRHRAVAVRESGGDRLEVAARCAVQVRSVGGLQSDGATHTPSDHQNSDLVSPI